MKSKLFVDDVVLGRPGPNGWQDQKYFYPCFVFQNGSHQFALFTEAEVKRAIIRAKMHPESVPVSENVLVKIFKLMRRFYG